MKKHIEHAIGSKNVFADIGLPNAQEHLVKAKLIMKIDDLMQARGLKQIDAASLFGVKQPGQPGIQKPETLKVAG